MSSAFRRGQLYWAEVPYLPERPLDILRRGRQKGELRVVLTFKRRPVLIVQNDRDNANPRYNYLLVAPIHSLPSLSRSVAVPHDVSPKALQLCRNSGACLKAHSGV